MRRSARNVYLGILVSISVPIQAQSKDRIWIHITQPELRSRLSDARQQNLAKVITQDGLLEPVTAETQKDESAPCPTPRDHGCTREQMKKVNANYGLNLEVRDTEGYTSFLIQGVLLDARSPLGQNLKFSRKGSRDEISAELLKMVKEFVSTRSVPAGTDTSIAARSEALQSGQIDKSTTASSGTRRTNLTHLSGILGGLAIASLAAGVTLAVLNDRQTGQQCSILGQIPEPQSMITQESRADLKYDRPCLYATLTGAWLGMGGFVLFGGGAGLSLYFR